MDQALEQPKLVQMTMPSFTEAWEMVAGQLRMEMKQADYETWVSSLKPLSFNEGVYRLGTVNAYARDWVESRLRTRIARLFEGIFNQPVTVHFVLHPAAEPKSLQMVEALTQAETQTVNVTENSAGNGATGGRKKKPAQPENGEGGSPRKIQLQRAYGTERARVIQPERGMFLTMYFFNNWLPLLGHSAMTTVLAARSLCYWNPMTGELRNVIETEMSELARRADVSVRTVKDVLNQPLVKKYFLRYKVRRVMTPNGVRTAGIILQVRMDDPLTPEDQEVNNLPEEERWYTVDFDDESDEE